MGRDGQSGMACGQCLLSCGQMATTVMTRYRTTLVVATKAGGTQRGEGGKGEGGGGEGGGGGGGEREGTLVRIALALLVALSRLRQVRCQLQQRPAALRECRSPTSGGAKATPAPIVGWRSWRIGAVGLQARSPTVAVPFASIWQIQLPILNISTEPNQSAKTGTCC